MNMMSLIQFDHGLWYVTGGMYNLARGLGRLLDDLGIKVRLESAVASINKGGVGVTGVTLASGEIISADYVVSNMEVIPAYRKLLGEGPAFLSKLEKFAPSCSGLVIHLGTNRIYDQLAHHNFFYSKDQNKHFDTVFQQGKLPEDPTIYLVAPTRTDPSKAPAGCDNIKILENESNNRKKTYTKYEINTILNSISGTYKELYFNIFKNKLQTLQTKHCKQNTIK